MAVIVIVVVHDVDVGVQFVGLNDALTPMGSPVTLNVTAWAVPAVLVAVIIVLAVCPCVNVTSPPFEREKLNPVGGAFTVKVKFVVRLIPPPLPVTVIVYGPVGVLVVVGIVRVVVQFGLQLVGLKVGVTPAGNPETLNDTAVVFPLVRLAVIVLVADCPWVTDIFPLLESEKSNTQSLGQYFELPCVFSLGVQI